MESVDPSKSVKVFLDGVSQDNNFLDLNFKNATDEFAWNFQIKYNVGLGIRNLEFHISDPDASKGNPSKKDNVPKSSGSGSSSGSSSSPSGGSSSRLLLRTLAEIGRAHV